MTTTTTSNHIKKSVYSQPRSSRFLNLSQISSNFNILLLNSDIYSHLQKTVRTIYFKGVFVLKGLLICIKGENLDLSTRETVYLKRKYILEYLYIYIDSCLLSYYRESPENTKFI